MKVATAGNKFVRVATTVTCNRYDKTTMPLGEAALFWLRDTNGNLYQSGSATFAKRPY